MKLLFNLSLLPILFVVLCLVGSNVAAQTFTQLDQSDVLVSTSETPPAESAAWQSASLPYHNRGIPLVDRPKVVWHRFELETPAVASAVYIWRYQTSAQVFLNDQYLGGTQDVEGWGTTSYWNYPLIVSIPSTVWNEEVNTLHIRVLGNGYGPVMSPVLIGDAMTLLDLWQDRKFFQADSSFVAFILCLLLAALALWLWRLRPEETLFARYAGACLSWAVVMWYFWGVYFPGTLLQFLTFMHLCVDLSVLMMISFVEKAQAQRQVIGVAAKSQSGLVASRAEKLLAGYWLATIPALILVPDDWFFYIAYFNHFVFVVSLVVVMFLASYRGLQRGVSISLWLVAAFAGVVVFALHDIFTFIFFNDVDWISQQGISQFSTVFILLSFLGFLGQRFLAALNETDRLNAELEDRVAKKQRELESAYDKTLNLELARNSLREKEKIYRDLHDDVGAKLVTIIQGDKTDTYGKLARSALENLRIAIFKTKYSNLLLQQLLDDSQEEALLRATAMGRAIEWNSTGDVPTMNLRGEVAYHLTRVFREAVSNSLKYGANAQVLVEQTIEHNRLTFSISNELDAVALGTGYSSGVENMKFRAGEIGAQLDWRQVEQRLCFELNLPLEKVAEKSPVIPLIG